MDTDRAPSAANLRDEWGKMSELVSSSVWHRNRSPSILLTLQCIALRVLGAPPLFAPSPASAGPAEGGIAPNGGASSLLDFVNYLFNLKELIFVLQKKAYLILMSENCTSRHARGTSEMQSHTV